jgi:uncharacterized protein (UPF0305 family)
MDVITKEILDEMLEVVEQALYDVDGWNLEEISYLQGKQEVINQLLEKLNEMSQLPGSKE